MSIELPELEIIESNSKIIKWEQLTNDYSLPYRAGEKQSFRLSPYNLEFKSIFEITGIFHVTTIETDFILDTEIRTIAILETGGITPKAEQLYNVYLRIRPQWIGNILQESMKRGYQLILNQMPPDSFDRMKKYLEKTIYHSIED
ncbi:MAG TPA: hypothetical protein VHB70_02240 [Parafilimonas sp.]|nr:hypothetical protein [Parafilimonas sp.]